MDDLSPAEQDLAEELSKLASDPSPAAREAIMGGVTTATRRMAQPRRWPRPWRLTAATALAVATVLATTVLAFASSSAALPDTPAYGLRWVGEHVRLAMLGPIDRELLRISFAREHFRQAQDVVHRNRTDAVQLLRDGREYLDEARNGMSSVPADEQGQVQGQLNQAGEDQIQTESRVGHQGD